MPVTITAAHRNQATLAYIAQGGVLGPAHRATRAGFVAGYLAAMAQVANHGMPQGLAVGLRAGYRAPRTGLVFSK